MVGKTNVGSSGKLFAVIAVTYPEGSICTCSDGTKTMKAKDTSGKALFNVAVGEWTVTATDGSSTASHAIIIKADGQIESVALSYETYYYNKGDKCTSVTGGWSKNGSGGSLTFNTASMTLVANNWHSPIDASTMNKVSLVNIKTLYFNVY